VDALAEALLCLARDPRLAARLAAGAAVAGRRHDWTDNARKVAALARQRVVA
jgi:glycosyltransferase involved in cell wall biosynthesis